MAPRIEGTATEIYNLRVKLTKDLVQQSRRSGSFTGEVISRKQAKEIVDAAITRHGKNTTLATIFSELKGNTTKPVSYGNNPQSIVGKSTVAEGHYLKGKDLNEYVAARKSELVARKGELKGKIFGQTATTSQSTGRNLPAVRYNDHPSLPNQQQLELNRMSQATVRSDFNRAVNNMVEDSRKLKELQGLQTSQQPTITTANSPTKQVSTYGKKLSASEIAAKKAELYKNLGEYRYENGKGQNKLFGGVEADRRAAEIIARNKAAVATTGTVVDDAAKTTTTVVNDAATAAAKSPKGFFGKIGQGIKNLFKGGAATEGAAKGATGGFLKGASSLGKYALKSGGFLAVAFEIPALIKAAKNGDFGKQCVRSGLSVLGGLAAGAICLAGGPIGVLVGGTLGYLIGKGIGEAAVGKSIADQKAEGTYVDPNAKPSFTGNGADKAKADKAEADKAKADETGKSGAGAAGAGEADKADKTGKTDKTDETKGTKTGATDTTTKTAGEYTIVKGDCIWNIVKKQYPELKTNAEILKKTKEIIKLNHLDTKEHKFGDLIFPKQGLDLAA